MCVSSNHISARRCALHSIDHYVANTRHLISSPCIASAIVSIVIVCIYSDNVIFMYGNMYARREACQNHREAFSSVECNFSDFWFNYISILYSSKWKWFVQILIRCWILGRTVYVQHRLLWLQWIKPLNKNQTKNLFKLSFRLLFRLTTSFRLSVITFPIL